jgi:hypothetical protein
VGSVCATINSSKQITKSEISRAISNKDKCQQWVWGVGKSVNKEMIRGCILY